MQVKLLPFQKYGVEKCLSAFADGERGFLFGDKMGLGKTIEALAVAEKMEKKYNLICVVCPTYVAPKWYDEIETKCDKEREYKFVVFTYSDLSNPQILAHAKKVKYDLIIFDEVHYAKSYQSQRGAATLGNAGLHTAAEKIVGLSGTMPPNNIGDLYLWLAASKNVLASDGYENFCRRFAAYCSRNQFGLQVRGFRPTAEFYAAWDKFYISREIDDVLNEIPQGIFIDQPLEIPDALAKKEIAIFGGLYDDPEIIEKALETLPDFTKYEEFSLAQGRAKAAHVAEYVKEVFNEIKKIIIFCRHREVAEYIFKKLGKNLRPTLITGTNTSADERFALVNKLNKAEAATIVATIGALGEGIDATGFYLTIFAEQDWRGYMREQARGRTRRIGQKRQVRYVDFYFNRGIDKAMRERVREKDSTSAKLKVAV